MLVTSPAMKSGHQSKPGQGQEHLTICGRPSFTQEHVDRYRVEHGLDPIKIEDLRPCWRCFPASMPRSMRHKKYW